VPFKVGTRRDSTDTLWKWRSLPGPTTCGADRISPSPTRSQTIGGKIRRVCVDRLACQGVDARTERVATPFSMKVPDLHDTEPRRQETN